MSACPTLHPTLTWPPETPPPQHTHCAMPSNAASYVAALRHMVPCPTAPTPWYLNPVVSYLAWCPTQSHATESQQNPSWPGGPAPQCPGFASLFLLCGMAQCIQSCSVVSWATSPILPWMAPITPCPISHTLNLPGLIQAKQHICCYTQPSMFSILI